MSLRTVRRMALTLLALLCAYVLALTAAYAIPNAWIESNVNESLHQYESEGAYAQYFFGYPYGQMDNMTDITMYHELMKAEGDSAIRAAMVPDYARYWHGYAVLLRPLSALVNVQPLRYFNMLWMMALLCVCFALTWKRLNLSAALACIGGLLMAFFLLAPFCFQFSTVFTLTLLFSTGVLACWDREQMREWLPVAFLAFGSLTHFFDFLTFPILTLAYPLVLVLLLRRRDGERTFRSELLCLVLLSASWCAGYGLTLLAKGLIGSLVTGQNVLLEIAENVSSRVGGELSPAYRELSARSAWLYNIEVFFNTRTVAALGLEGAALAVLALRRRAPLRVWAAELPVLGVALYPYVWYTVLQNHSCVHFFFTSKAQAATAFALCAYLIAVRARPLEKSGIDK